MTLEQRGECLIILDLPVEQMGLLTLGIAFTEEESTVLHALLRGERVFVLDTALAYKQYKKTAPLGIYKTFVGLERQLREMGIGILREKRY